MKKTAFHNGFAAFSAPASARQDTDVALTAHGRRGLLPPWGRMRLWVLMRCPQWRRGLLLGCVLLCTGLLSTGFWAVGPEQGRQVTAIRMSMNHRNTLVANQDTPHVKKSPSAQSAWTSGGITSYRATLQDISPYEFARPSTEGAEQPPLPGLLIFAEGAVHIGGFEGNSPFDRLQELSERVPHAVEPEEFALSLFTLPESRHAFLRPETRLEELARECRVPPMVFADGLSRIMNRFGISFSDMPDKRSGLYQAVVSRYAKRYNLSPGLIYAIMRTESAFNPLAVSNSGALGLMQLVPGTAGIEAHSYITGKAENPTQSLLFNPENNIQYGTAYLHLLHTRHFPGVINPVSRELCVIAAYNGGSGAVLKVFDQNKDAALAAINSLSPEQVYERLAQGLPTEENRRYIDKVLSFIRSMPEES